MPNKDLLLVIQRDLESVIAAVDWIANDIAQEDARIIEAESNGAEGVAGLQSSSAELYEKTIADESRISAVVRQGKERKINGSVPQLLVEALRVARQIIRDAAPEQH